jgi:hypothetical protein
MWLRHLLLTLTIAGVLSSIPCPSDAGSPADRSGMGRAGGFRAPSTIPVSPHTGVSSSFRAPFRSFRNPLVGVGSTSVWIGPPQVVVVPVFVQQQVTREAPAPPPEPKFVFPPTPSASSPSGPRTVIVQRGSKTETQSFPVDR